MAHQIKELTDILKEWDPTLTVRVESPDDPAGESYLDIFADNFAIEISYRPDYGFGVFLADDGFGQRSDEVYREPSKAVGRIMQLRSQGNCREIAVCRPLGADAIDFALLQRA